MWAVFVGNIGKPPWKATGYKKRGKGILPISILFTMVPEFLLVLERRLPCGSSQSSVTLVPEDLMPSTDLGGPQTYIWCSGGHVGKTPVHIKYINLKKTAYVSATRASLHRHD